MIRRRLDFLLWCCTLSVVTKRIVAESSFALPPSFALGASPEVSEYDLLGAVKIPFQDSKTQYIDEDGHDGFPAFGFKAGSDVKIAHRQILPEKLASEFSILISAKPRTRRGGFIFAVVNPYDTVVELGVRIAPEGLTTTVLSLFYTDSSQINSQIIANFTVSKFQGKWTRFAFRITAENVTLFFNCNETETVLVKREPLELVFDSASTLYIAQAGPTGEPYEGALDQVKIFRDPNMASEQCKTDFQGFQNLNPDYENEIVDDVERTDYDGPQFREGSGSDDLGLFPPPPPPPDAARKYHGEKGERGPRGPSGESIRGPPGPPGPPGNPGLAANESVCSCNVTSILNTFLGSNGAFSPELRSTYDNKEGPPGMPGQPGYPGEKGNLGNPGEKGDRGERGPQGPEGPLGPKGVPGKDGIPGVPGPPGLPGPPGPIEFENVDDNVMGGTMARAGVPGPKGDSGKPGPSGPRGDKGAMGPKGSRGDNGTKGERGDRGLQGERGPPGFKGDAGLDGIPGTPGKHGDKGGKGESGAPGPPGVSIDSSGDMTGFIPGTPGLKGEPGEKGESGNDGEPGIPGVDGPVGPSGLKGEPGIDGALGPVGPPGNKGERGERGPPGAVIMQDGQEQILTLKGEKGDMGKRGRRGKPGGLGPAGPPGKPGTLGEIGLPGWMGRPGTAGIPGLKGEKGEPSISIKGEKGDRGADGRDGNPGPPGPSPTRLSDETIQYIPVPGPPGPPGPAGTPGLSITGPKGEPGGSGYGEATYHRPAKSSFEELKALRELKDLKNLSSRATATPPIFTTAPDQEVTSRIVPGALTFQNRNAMSTMSHISPVGTLAYLIDEEALLVRVNSGWQYVILGSLVTPPTTTNSPTTNSPQLKPPFEASNLISHIGKPEKHVSNWYPKMLRMAALNEPHSGDIHGVRGADYACYREARRAGLRGTFRAFLSSRVQNVDSIVRQLDRNLPVSNLKGEVLFDSWSDMFKSNGAPFEHASRIYSFNGKDVLSDGAWPHKAIWHGALINGERALETSCDAWHSASRDKVGLGGSLKGPKLLEQSSFHCDQKLVLLCIEATTELFVQRRRRDLDSRGEDELLGENEYYNLLNSIH